jgi:hypothetical protein
VCATVPTPPAISVILVHRLSQHIPAGIEIRTKLQRSARASMWIAGLSISVLAVSGIVAFDRSIPASYASIPPERATARDGAVPARSGDDDTRAAPERSVAERDPIARRSRTQCPDCGVVESVRKTATMTADVSGDKTGREDAGSATVQKDYEITIRFRDGSRTVLNQASLESWRLGSRVIVIGRSTAPNN